MTAPNIFSGDRKLGKSAPEVKICRLKTIKVITKLPNSEQSYKGKVAITVYR
jgi:hypothetical protein